ncbi:hypothetical protein ACLOJK_040046 [Asimina triloba]
MERSTLVKPKTLGHDSMMARLSRILERTLFRLSFAFIENGVRRRHTRTNDDHLVGAWLLPCILEVEAEAVVDVDLEVQLE